MFVAWMCYPCMVCRCLAREVPSQAGYGGALALFELELGSFGDMLMDSYPEDFYSLRVPAETILIVFLDAICVLAARRVDDYLGGAASGVANVFVARSGDDGVRCPDVGVRSVGPSMADKGDS
ncbi:hypothetical protein Tco_0973769 [Tanacetum coccineum]|uniref:Uncharacterized protein n=1 Tax=Tanacetum coccineum TaxID=301880 RepID=A0ABQ5E9R5_9ASTR